MCASPTFHKWKVKICIQPGHALSCPTQKYKALGHDGSCPAHAPTKIFIVGKLFLKHAYNPFPFLVSEISFMVSEIWYQVEDNIELGHFLSCDAMHLTYITYKFTTPLPDSSTDNPMWGVSIAQAKDSSHARSIGK